MYRLDPSQNKDRLNLAESYRIAVSLIEWADRLQDLPPERLDIYINILSASDKVKGMQQRYPSRIHVAHIFALCKEPPLCTPVVQKTCMSGGPCRPG